MKKFVRFDEPIIKSLFDLDFYKLAMGKFIHHYHPNVEVMFEFKNRTKGVNLLDEIRIEELKEQLDHVLGLFVDTTQLHYLRGTNEYGKRMFDGEEYLSFLGLMRLCSYEIVVENGVLIIRARGPWSVVTYWETIILAIVNELRTRNWLRKQTRYQQDRVYAEGMRRLWEKVEFLKNHPEIIFSEFGTRRRFSRLWQDYIVGLLASEISGSQLRGTSNVELAMKYGLLAMGTNAHELPMVYSAIYAEEDDKAGWLVSQRRMLEDWEEMYGVGLSIMLPDTYSTKYFLEHTLTPDIARRWKGSRQDSGDPIVYGEMWIEYYKRHGIDPCEKMIIFSDGLDIDVMYKLATHFAGRIQVSFGWGTNLTNDLGLKPLSLVMKAVAAWINGRKIHLAKLSDNIDKATGEDGAVAKKKRQTGYEVTFHQQPTY